MKEMRLIIVVSVNSTGDGDDGVDCGVGVLLVGDREAVLDAIGVLITVKMR